LEDAEPELRPGNERRGGKVETSLFVIRERFRIRSDARPAVQKRRPVAGDDIRM